MLALFRIVPSNDIENTSQLAALFRYEVAIRIWARKYVNYQRKAAEGKRGRPHRRSVFTISEKCEAHLKEWRRPHPARRRRCTVHAVRFSGENAGELVVGNNLLRPVVLRDNHLAGECLNSGIQAVDRCLELGERGQRILVAAFA